MAKKRLRIKPHEYTDTVHDEVAAQTPIIPQRNEQTESGRHRILESRTRVGHSTDRELLNVPFPPEK